MSAYYNEIDPLKAEVLREAIKAGAIAAGDVDERSIVDVQPGDLAGYTQCHFFAGGGFWSLALRWAGWPDDREVWTGSCPCPSFSAAGKGAGFSDPRHLWPDWIRLIRECRPPTVIGEQVSAAIGHGWLDLIQSDLEGADYAVGSAVLGAGSVGAPHIRQRLYFCADTADLGYDRRGAGETSEWPSKSERSCDAGDGADTDGRQPCDGDVQRSGELGLFAPDRGTVCSSDTLRERGQQERGSSSGDEAENGRARWNGSEPDSNHIASGDEQTVCSAHSLHSERRPLDVHGEDGCDGQDDGRTEAHGEPGACGEVCVGDHTISAGLEGHFGDVREWRGPGWLDPITARSVAEAGATRGYWRDCDWWWGTDGKWRPVGPGIQPLAFGSPARVGRLRLYGDGIVVPLAAEFIKAYLESRLT